MEEPGEKEGDQGGRGANHGDQRDGKESRPAGPCKQGRDRILHMSKTFPQQDLLAEKVETSLSSLHLLTMHGQTKHSETLKMGPTTKNVPSGKGHQD